jgi:hypothetical protein
MKKKGRNCFRLIWGLILLSITGNLLAQQEVEIVTKNYKFNDGVYFSFSDFKQNQPILRWEEVQGSLFSNPEAFTVKAETLKQKSLGSTAENLLDSIWGFTIGGIPYIKIKKKKEDLLTLFSGMRVRGQLSYFSYVVREERDINFSAINPYTAKPFRSTVEKRSLKLKKEKILLFDTGEIMDYSYENMEILIKDDPTLLRALYQIEDYELEEKMFKCLLIYNDRHVVKTTATTPN